MSRSIMDILSSNTKTPPKYLPGDLVMLEDDCFGVIVEANNTINGSRVEWNKPFPDEIEHMWPPSYSIRSIPGLKSAFKGAWFYEDEIIGFMENGKSELHKYRSFK